MKKDGCNHHEMKEEMESPVLSKSSFIRALQCSKSLYLHKNSPHLKDTLTLKQKAVFSRGHNVGALARNLFPGGTEVCTRPNQAAAIRTEELIKKGVTVLYEPVFIFQGVICALDILVKNEDKWYAYEVKSSLKITPTYILDASLQYFIINGCGLHLHDISLIHVNDQYVKNGALEYDKLFKITSILDDVLKQQKFVNEKIDWAKEQLSFPIVPDVEIGEHCFTPYPCDFRGLCWRHLPKNSVFEISGMTKTEQFDLYNKGYLSASAIPANYPLNKNAKVHANASKDGNILINQFEIKRFIDELKYPISFFDLETFMPAVPIFDTCRPFHHLPFQFSVHIKESKESPVVHKEFLAEAGSDPRKSFVKNFIASVPNEGTVLVYGAGFERSVLNELRGIFPESAKDIESRINRIKDLMNPFEAKHYYHPVMMGSHSIKNVLPAMVPELSYNDLAISNGNMAISAFEGLQTETDIFKIAETRDALLEYCKLDTFAMIKILEVLEKAVC